MEFLNPVMLFGLAGLSIPVIVHLLSRRRVDVIEWGAMQFLEPTPRQRRSLWIENFWLMVVRMALLAALALALARPWFESMWLARLTTSRPQDVALVIDGSYSLNRTAENQLVSDKVRRHAREVLEQLDASDLVQVYDARELVRPLLPGYTRDLGAAREAILDLPQPTGASNLVAALNIAARDLLRTGNLDREIVVVSDGQRRPWNPDDAAAWQSFDTLRKQARIPPRVWVLNVSEPDGAPPRNLSIGPMSLSRELAMPGAEIRVRAPIQSTGSAAPVACEVQLEIDGVPSPTHLSTVRVPGNGAASIEFDIKLDQVGCHALTLRLQQEDDLATDNLVTAVVEIGGGWPVLLVDGAPQRPQPEQAETFFLQAALDAGATGWIRPEVVTSEEWNPAELPNFSAVILANVGELTAEQLEALQEFLAGGGGVLVTGGDRWQPVNAQVPAKELPEIWRWLNVRPLSIAGSADDAEQATTITAESLQLPWQERFRKQRTGGFCDVRYRQWWKFTWAQADDALMNDAPLNDAQADDPPMEGVAAGMNHVATTARAEKAAISAQATPSRAIVARFASGDPALLWQRRGEGTLAIWASTIDADWNALVTQPDYVAWWHEVLFALLEPASRRNVAIGQPLIARAPPEEANWTGLFLGPNDVQSEGEEWTLGSQSGRRLPPIRWPGLYLFVPHGQPTKTPAADIRRRLALGTGQVFSAQADVGESELESLSEADRELLASDRPLQFLTQAAELRDVWLGDSGRSELSLPLLYLLLALLVLEVAMTRRLIRRGGGDTPQAG